MQMTIIAKRLRPIIVSLNIGTALVINDAYMVCVCVFVYE